MDTGPDGSEAVAHSLRSLHRALCRAWMALAPVMRNSTPNFTLHSDQGAAGSVWFQWQRRWRLLPASELCVGRSERLKAMPSDFRGPLNVDPLRPRDIHSLLGAVPFQWWIAEDGRWTCSLGSNQGPILTRMLRSAGRTRHSCRNIYRDGIFSMRCLAPAALSYSRRGSRGRFLVGRFPEAGPERALLRRGDSSSSCMRSGRASGPFATAPRFSIQSSSLENCGGPVSVSLRSPCSTKLRGCAKWTSRISAECYQLLLTPSGCRPLPRISVRSRQSTLGLVHSDETCDERSTNQMQRTRRRRGTGRSRVSGAGSLISRR